jgi:hypothetical protein
MNKIPLKLSFFIALFVGLGLGSGKKLAARQYYQESKFTVQNETGGSFASLSIDIADSTGSDSVIVVVPPVDSVDSTGSDSVIVVVPPVDSVDSTGSDSVIVVVPPVDSVDSTGSDSVIVVVPPVDSVDSTGSDSVIVVVPPVDSVDSTGSDSVIVVVPPVNSIGNTDKNLIDKQALSVGSLKNSKMLSVQSLYPLPAHEHLTLIIQSEKEQNVQIELIDILGGQHQLSPETWLSAGENQIELDLSSFRQGNYIYKITGEGIMLMDKILIVR